MLKLVTAIIKPHRLEEVVEALQEAEVIGLTASEVRGFGRQGGHSEVYRGSEYIINLLPKVRVEVLCAADDAERIAKLITDAARTGQIGDGKVWVTPVEHAARIRTGELGIDAL
jgi:nitrogen regulatory protein P-II 1